MKSLFVGNDTFDWFKHACELKDEEGNIYAIMSDNDLLIRLLNMWEAGNMQDNVKYVHSNKIFPHENGKFYRGLEGTKPIQQPLILEEN